MPNAKTFPKLSTATRVNRYGVVSQTLVSLPLPLYVSRSRLTFGGLTPGAEYTGMTDATIPPSGVAATPHKLMLHVPARSASGKNEVLDPSFLKIFAIGAPPALRSRYMISLFWTESHLVK